MSEISSRRLIHDLKNSLTIIGLNSMLLRLHKKEVSTLAPIIEKEVKKMAQTVESLSQLLSETKKTDSK